MLGCIIRNTVKRRWVQHMSVNCCRRSVPSGRVGGAKDALFQSNERFREAVRSQEDADVAVLEVRRWKHCCVLAASEAWLCTANSVPAVL